MVFFLIKNECIAILIQWMPKNVICLVGWSGDCFMAHQLLLVNLCKSYIYIYIYIYMYIYIYIYIYIYMREKRKWTRHVCWKDKRKKDIRGSLNTFPAFFFVWALLLIVHTRNSSPLRSNLHRLQCTCCTVSTTSERPHGSTLVWACQWPSSQPLSSPQLSHNDSL